MNNIFFVIIILILIIYVFMDIKTKKITVRESFWWSFVLRMMLLLAIFPYSIDIAAGWVGISYPPAFLLTLCSLFLLMMNYKSSKKISNMNQKIISLEQELAIKKEKTRREKKKNG